MRILTYLIGVPGAGKSTLLREATKGAFYDQRTEPVPHALYLKSQAIQLGVIGNSLASEKFPGTDRLSMSIQPKALAFLRSMEFDPFDQSDDTEARVVIAEGDRLGNAAFFGAILADGWTLELVYLDTPPEIAQKRRDERGTEQNQTWIKGRESKVRKLVETFSGSVIRIDGSLPLRDQVARMRELRGISLIMRTVV